jgi:hypothetical protein
VETTRRDEAMESTSAETPETPETDTGIGAFGIMHFGQWRCRWGRRRCAVALVGLSTTQTSSSRHLRLLILPLASICASRPYLRC